MGVNLLDVPVEVLQSVSKHFLADEWASESQSYICNSMGVARADMMRLLARGPSQACLILNRMQLPRMRLRPPFPYQAANSPDFDATCKARVSENIIASLKWAAARVRSVSMEVCFHTYEGIASEEADNPLIQALNVPSARDGLQHLESLSCHIISFGADQAAIACFQDWLLRHIPALEAASMWLPRICLRSHLRFQHMRFMHVRAASFDSLDFRAANQLPALENLCLEGHVFSSIDELNLTGSKHLRAVTLETVVVQKLPLDPTCRLRYLMKEASSDADFQDVIWKGPIRTVLGRADQIRLYCEEDFVQYTHGMCGYLARMEVLSLSWPLHIESDAEEEEGGGWPAEDVFTEGAEFLLMNCMPANRQPLHNLKSMIITGYNIAAIIPPELPALEELVILADRHVNLSFEDASAFPTALKRFLSFGQPLVANGLDVAKILCDLVGCGQNLDAVMAQEEGETFREDSSCLFMRPITVPDWSIEDLFDAVLCFTRRCRCECCVFCLRRVGHVLGRELNPFAWRRKWVEHAVL